MPAQTDHHVGGTKHFECRVKGHPRPEIRWFKDGKEITHIPRYKFDYSHEGVISMVIPDITHDDEGHYRCRAENSEGFASTSAYLFVRAHKEHPEEAVTSFHAMEIEEAVVFTEKEKKARRDSKTNVSEPHFETPIEDVDVDHSKERRLSKEEEEVVRKSFESVIESSASTREISSSTSSSAKTAAKTVTNGSEQESAKISGDMSEKAYHSSEESSDDVDSVRLKTISERSETTSLRESIGDLDEDEQEKSLLMRQTKRIFSQDFDEESDLFKLDASSMMEMASAKMKMTSSSTTESLSSAKSESMTMTAESSVSKVVSTTSETDSQSGKITSKTEISSSTSAMSVSQTTSSGKAGEDAKEEGMQVTSSSSISEAASTKKAEVVVEESSTSLVSSSVTESSAKSEMAVEKSGAKGKAAEVTTAKTEVSTDSDDAVPKSHKGETEISNFSSLQDDSGFLEASSLLETSRADESLLMTSQSEVSEAAASDTIESKISAESETDSSSKKSRRDEEELTARSESETLAEKSSREDYRKLEVSVDTEAKKAADKRAIEAEYEEEGESVTESETEGSVGSVVGVEISATTASTMEKLEKEGSKESDKAGEEAKQETGRKIAAEVDDRKDSLSDETAAEIKQETGRKTDLKVDDEKDLDKTGKEAKEEVGRKTGAEKDSSSAEKKASRDRSSDDVDGRKTDAEKDSSSAEKKESSPDDAEKKASRDRSSDDVDGKGRGDAGQEKEDQTDKGKVELDEDSRERRRRSQPEEEEMTREEVVETRSSWVEKVEAEEDKGKVVTSEPDEAEAEGGNKGKEEEVKAEPPAEPKIVQKMEDVKMETGKTLKLRTQVQGTPQPEVKWSKDGRTVRQGERITLVTENDVYSLEIEEVRESDSGTYRLTAVNSAGEIFSDVMVNITSSEPSSLAPGETQLSMAATIGIPEFVMQPQDVSVGEFETIKLTCSVRGDPAPKVSWEKEGKVVRSNRRVRVFEASGVYNLEIHDCEAEDAGEYVCVAVNSQGRTAASVHVIIDGVESVTSITEDAEPEGVTSQPVEEATQGAVGGAVESSSDVRSSDTRTVRYLKLIGMAAAFSLAAFGVKKVLDNLHK